jgi:hypothetical protein
MERTKRLLALQNFRGRLRAIHRRRDGPFDLLLHRHSLQLSNSRKFSIE